MSRGPGAGGANRCGGPRGGSWRGNKVTHQNTELGRGPEARGVGRFRVSLGLTLKGTKEVEERAGHRQGGEGLTGVGCGFLGGQREAGWGGF